MEDQSDGEWGGVFAGGDWVQMGIGWSGVDSRLSEIGDAGALGRWLRRLLTWRRGDGLRRWVWVRVGGVGSRSGGERGRKSGDWVWAPCAELLDAASSVSGLVVERWL